MLEPFTRLFKVQSRERGLTWGDLVALALVAVLVYAGAQLAFAAPEVIQGPEISLSPKALPWYALLSVGRMAAAYALSLGFALVYGRLAAYHPPLESFLMPLLDVLQSVPILSFLPVVLLSLSVLLPEAVAVEVASIVLIFTSQAWNLTFAWYQSLTTIPKELREASGIFRLNGWMRFRRLELPFATISLVWNSMMSWAGGWFFLMAAEIFTVGQKDFRLPGLGAYLQAAASQGDFQAVLWGLGALVLVILALDQLVWRPLLAWSDRFKIGLAESEDAPTSWFYQVLHSSRLLEGISHIFSAAISEPLDRWFLERFPAEKENAGDSTSRSGAQLVFTVLLLAGIGFGVYRAALMLATLPAREWLDIALGLAATTLRVAAALLIALAWTVPVGVAIGTNKRLAAFLQPVVQVAASIPATALFPVLLLVFLRLPQGLNIAAVLLMLLGTQWYLLFNIIAGANAIPQDLKYTARLMNLGSRETWLTLNLPALFPYLVTGMITASGGAWNASIVAEYAHFSGQILQTRGIGALIAQATASGDYALLLASTLSMILVVVLINRLVWHRLYQLAEENYRME